MDVEKEVSHNCDNVQVRARSAETNPWNSFPYNQWEGFKFIARDVNGGAGVHFEIWRDLADGAGGGDWQKLFQTDDIGGWGTGLVACGNADPADKVLSGPNLSILMRNDDVSDFRYKRWSVREIAPQ